MKPYISPEMQNFLKPRMNEEAVDQPLYHIQAIATTSATSYTFFNTAAGGYAVTNMDAASVLSKGKRFGIFSIGFAFIPGQAPFNTAAAATTAGAISAANDAKVVLESAGYLQLQVLDKTYLIESPLSRVPAGIGVPVSGAVQQNLVAAADKVSLLSGATNGLPIWGACRKLRVPIPLPEQVKFTVTVNFSSALTLTTAGSIGVWLDGLLVRAVQ